MTMEDLGRRAIACEGWRWMPGMQFLDRTASWCTVLHATEGGPVVAWNHTMVDVLTPDPHWTPDFEDAATLGCLEALVLEAYAGCKITIHRNAGLKFEWALGGDCGLLIPGSPATFEEALVCALEGR